MTPTQMADRIAAMRTELAAMEAALRRPAAEEAARRLGLAAITKLGDLAGVVDADTTEEEIDAVLYGGRRPAEV